MGPISTCHHTGGEGFNVWILGRHRYPVHNRQCNETERPDRRGSSPRRVFSDFSSHWETTAHTDPGLPVGTSTCSSHLPPSLPSDEDTQDLWHVRSMLALSDSSPYRVKRSKCLWPDFGCFFHLPYSSSPWYSVQPGGKQTDGWSGCFSLAPEQLPLVSPYFSFSSLAAQISNATATQLPGWELQGIFWGRFWRIRSVKTNSESAHLFQKHLAGLRFSDDWL